MGVLHGRDLLSPKFITAEITDAEDRVHYVPIKHTIGDYFFTELDGKFFAFTLKNARILIYRQTLTRSFRVIQYDTSNYTSLKAEMKEIEIILKKNSLPKINIMMFNILKVLGRREKGKFEVHDINELVKEFEKKEGQFPEEVKNIKRYLEELAVDKIVTPVRKITEYIQEDLIATSPSFLGEMLPRLQRLDNEHKKITNTPLKGDKAFMKLIIIGLLIAMVGAAIYILYDQGAFEGITSIGDSILSAGEGFQGIPSPMAGFQTPPPTIGGIDYSDEAIMERYPDPVDLQRDVNNGTVDYNQLSDFVKQLLDDLPDAEPIPIAP